MFPSRLCRARKIRPISSFLIVFTVFSAQVLSAGTSSVSPAKQVALTPVILIPGTSRAQLANETTGSIVWGNTRGLFQLRDRDNLALSIDSADLRENRNGLVPVRLLEKFSVVPHVLEFYSYEGFFKKMISRSGYRLGDIDHPRAGDNFFVFLYDWRRDNVEHAEELARKIERLKAFYGDPKLKFDVIAHCNALYIAWYYALYGGRDVLEESNPVPTDAGAGNIRKLILISPPFRGTLQAFRVVHEGFKVFQVPFVRKLTVYSAFTMPAFYQLFPPARERVFLDSDGREMNVDLYDPSNWIRYGWSVFGRKEQKRLERKCKKLFPSSWKEEFQKENDKRLKYLKVVLGRAEAFHRAIDEETKNLPDSVKTYSLILNKKPTLEQVELVPETGEIRFGGRVKKSEGDTIVTVVSMRGRFRRNRPKEIVVRTRHRQMASSPLVHDQVIGILESEGR